MIGWFLILIFLFLVFIRIPVPLALLFPAAGYIIVFDLPIIVIARELVGTVDSFTLIAVPMFIFAGTLMNNTGLTDDLLDLATKTIGHTRGGLAQTNIVTSLIFSGISGSALADVSGIGKILIPTMHENGYDKDYSAALTSVSATVGPIFPPSIPLIIFGVLAETSALSLLLAGIIPAVLCTVILMAQTAYIARKKGFPASEPANLRKIGEVGIQAIPALLAPIILIGGLLTGLFGVTEISVVTVIYIIFIDTILYRSLTLKNVWESGKETVRLTSTILFIVATAGLFSWVLALTNVTATFASMLISLGGNLFLALIVVNLFLLTLGLFLEPLSAMVMSIPVVVPPLVSMGANPVHIGVLMVFNLMIGLVTPPLGLSIFITSDIAGSSVDKIVREVVPYYVGLIFTLLLITFIPSLSIMIPKMVL